MVTIIIGLHWILCVILILIVLLQAGHSGGIASTFGGGASDTIWGTRRGNILTRITAIAAGLFMITSILLTITLPTQKSVIQKKGYLTPEQFGTSTPTLPSVGGQELPSLPEDVGTETETEGVGTGTVR